MKPRSRYIMSADGHILLSERHRQHSVTPDGAPTHDEPEIRTEFRCVYCGEPMPAGCPDPSLFSCCGEIGHVEEVAIE